MPSPVPLGGVAIVMGVTVAVSLMAVSRRLREPSNEPNRWRRCDRACSLDGRMSVAVAATVTG